MRITPDGYVPVTRREKEDWWDNYEDHHLPWSQLDQYHREVERMEALASETLRQYYRVRLGEVGK